MAYRTRVMVTIEGDGGTRHITDLRSEAAPGERWQATTSCGRTGLLTYVVAVADASTEDAEAACGACLGREGSGPLG